jgi:hypothetical protein
MPTDNGQRDVGIDIDDIDSDDDILFRPRLATIGGVGPKPRNMTSTMRRDSLKDKQRILMQNRPNFDRRTSQNTMLNSKQRHTSPVQPPRATYIPKSPPCVRAYLAGIYGKELVERIPPVFIGGVWGRTASLGEPYEETLRKAKARGVKVDFDFSKKRKNSKDGDGKKRERKVVFFDETK